MQSIIIVGLVGSPRKGMNTDSFVSKALEGAKEMGAITKKVYLNDLQIKPCQACTNPPTDAICIYKDGMDEIYSLMETVDGIIVGSPAYYGSISSQLKLVIDRSNCMTEFIKYPDGKFSFKTKVKKHKKGVLIWVAGSSTDPTHAVSEVSQIFKDVNAELIDTFVVTDADRGEGARNQPELLQRAFSLGQKLVKKQE